MDHPPPPPPSTTTAKRTRTQCTRTPKCNGKSSHLYCAICCHPLEGQPAPSPVSLPLELHMYRHPGEKVSKSTSIHAKVVAPADTTMFVEDCKDLGKNVGGILNDRYPDPSRVLLLFPSDDAKPLSKLPRSSFDKLIVLDGTWTQAKAMYLCLKDAGFQPVTIGFPANASVAQQTQTEKTASIDQNNDLPESPSKKRNIDSTSSIDASTSSLTTIKDPEPVKTLFWRYQKVGDHALATIEAVYYFYRDYFNVYESGKEYDGRFDGLLYYFRLQYETVQGYYKANPDKQFTKKKSNAESYIKK
ncbi:DTW domain-containing protein 1 [Rhizoclosmatium sp. JEL0117]|nr:DTW domain-containing protein 1 [Rhizoclosmatium sp. JEL0117]